MRFGKSRVNNQVDGSLDLTRADTSIPASRTPTSLSKTEKAACELQGRPKTHEVKYELVERRFMH